MGANDFEIESGSKEKSCFQGTLFRIIGIVGLVAVGAGIIALSVCAAGHCDCEYVYTIASSGRFRMSLMKERNGYTLSSRIISKSLRSFDESGMPDACRGLTEWAQGMVLVTGPAGCGKSETLATLVEMINQTRADHIITIESPIEHVFESKKSQITQRQIDFHTLSQESALRAALREDPDIIMISELRDLQSIRLAVTAAETGHLVLATMNTNSAIQTVSTFINSFPPDEQEIMTNMITESLRGVISQQLIPRADGSGLIPAYEVMLLNMAVQNTIKQKRYEQLENIMSTNRSSGMVVFDDSLKALVDANIITIDEAYNRAFNPKYFIR